MCFSPPIKRSVMKLSCCLLCLAAVSWTGTCLGATDAPEAPLNPRLRAAAAVAGAAAGSARAADGDAGPIVEASQLDKNVGGGTKWEEEVAVVAPKDKSEDSQVANKERGQSENEEAVLRNEVESKKSSPLRVRDPAASLLMPRLSRPKRSFHYKSRDNRGEEHHYNNHHNHHSSSSSDSSSSSSSSQFPSPRKHRWRNRSRTASSSSSSSSSSPSSSSSLPSSRTSSSSSSSALLSPSSSSDFASLPSSSQWSSSSSSYSERDRRRHGGGGGGGGGGAEAELERELEAEEGGRGDGRGRGHGGGQPPISAEELGEAGRGLAQSFLRIPRGGRRYDVPQIGESLFDASFAPREF